MKHTVPRARGQFDNGGQGSVVRLGSNISESAKLLHAVSIYCMSWKNEGWEFGECDDVQVSVSGFGGVADVGVIGTSELTGICNNVIGMIR